VVNANASEELRELAGSDRFPVTSTLMGLGAFPASNENWLGMLGMHGTRSVAKRLRLASRFAQLVTGCCGI